ncbi:MAG: ChaN family lipoprotein [Bacteroidota bacterium]
MMKQLIPAFTFGLLALLLPLSGFAQADEAFKIYDTRTQKTISLEQLVSEVDQTDVLFFGEEHNDSIAHLLQDKLYTLLLDRYKTVALSLEMFETDCQQVLDEYLQGHITESKLTNDARAWSNYPKAYSPLVETAKQRKQVVIAANAPRRYVNIVSRNGLSALKKLPKSSRRYLPPMPIFTADAPYEKRFREIMGDTGHNLDINFFHAQCTWDATMAYRIYRHWRKNKKDLVFHLNGRFHTDYRHGTVAQLQRQKKKLKIKNISCFPVDDFDQPNWKAYSDIGDFVIISRR